MEGLFFIIVVITIFFFFSFCSSSSSSGDPSPFRALSTLRPIRNLESLYLCLSGTSLKTCPAWVAIPAARPSTGILVIADTAPVYAGSTEENHVDPQAG